ncbi:formylglycine-generating enzyme family protein [Planktothrix pseudagardhii]|uniref:Formylglycine-generating enzyme n=1 Tax=Planktothrix pseudagardhii TaxID=132604 RepID=A0A9W4G609_9CYAN|nr:formylglycine-generating enzyme family protein [Planktothrix pseudagardhii]CAD5949796.1 Formylglycine-generating enzyme [Planktothrix pseudagardhii]
MVHDIRQQLADHRLEAFAERFPKTMDLLCHAAFPLALTPHLLYCLRENFVPDCDFIAVADILLSSLCVSVGRELYAIDGKVRDLLLRRLKANFGERRLNRLADYMTGYIQQQISLPHNSRIAWQLGPEPHWTALAYTRPGEALKEIRTAIEQALKQPDAQERVRLASLVESYGDLLQETGFAPILTLAQQLEAEPSEELPLSVFSFETVTVNNRGKIIKRETKQARYFTEDLGDGVTLEMVYIPGGTFLMGSLEMEKDIYESERPQHQVTIPPFFMAKYPITQAQWKAVANWPKIQRDLNPDPSDFKGDNRPVENVSWYDVVEFCARLLQHTRRNYCLPSEAQWEYACRAGTQTPFYFGKTITSDLANYDGNYTYAEEPKGKYREETTPVGEFPPNAFGLYDLHGNVWEWCADPWHENYKKAPTGGEVWGEKNDNDNLYQIYDLENLVNLLNRNDIRVMRGGSWIGNPRNCRSALRNRYEPGSRFRLYGFRVVSLPPAWTL